MLTANTFFRYTDRVILTKNKDQSNNFLESCVSQTSLSFSDFLWVFVIKIKCNIIIFFTMIGKLLVPLSKGGASASKCGIHTPTSCVVFQYQLVTFRSTKMSQRMPNPPLACWYLLHVICDCISNGMESFNLLSWTYIILYLSMGLKTLPFCCLVCGLFP